VQQYIVSKKIQLIEIVSNANALECHCYFVYKEELHKKLNMERRLFFTKLTVKTKNNYTRRMYEI
jgi:hypothetical protein